MHKKRGLTSCKSSFVGDDGFEPPTAYNIKTPLQTPIRYILYVINLIFGAVLAQFIVCLV